ncbi:MAG TPA: hypothetical protein PLP05_08090, partial [Sedimentisphaerales bacterium]|nr:hypothetical protein [Sedimentisphaerales bacterium]
NTASIKVVIKDGLILSQFIVDNVDYPFVDDPEVLGLWKSVDYVQDINGFNPDKKSSLWGDLFLHEMIFSENGKLISKNDNEPEGYPETWTKGLVVYDNDLKTASKYIIKEIDGFKYMFFEWKGGDYTYRHKKPAYYVLTKAEKVEETSNAPQILTSAYLVFVPTDMPEDQELIGMDITPEKLEAFLNVVRNNPQARILAAPQLVTNDGEIGVMRTSNYENASIEMRITNTFDPDDKTIKVELSFNYSCKSPKESRVTRTLLSTETTTKVASGHAFAVGGMSLQENQATILLVSPKILERKFSQTGVVVDAGNAEMENRFAELRKAGESLGIAEDKLYYDDEKKMEERIESAKKLSDCGKALIMYANGHEGDYPDSLEQVKPYIVDEEIYNWLVANVEYLAKGKKVTILPDEMIAYDKTMLADGAEGSNVLLNDFRVEFKKKEFFEKKLSNFEIVDIELEPMVQGKNILYVTVKNTCDT